MEIGYASAPQIVEGRRSEEGVVETAEVRLVLVPIKKPADGVYAHLYARGLRARGILVNVGLLHVIGQITETAPDFNSRTHDLMLSKEARAQVLLNEAA